jgi:uncharacterized membrane protein
MNQDIGRAIVFSIPAVSAAVSLIMISLDITRSSNTVNRKIHYSIITVYCLIILYWSGLVMYSIARDAFIAYLPVCFSSFSFIPIFLYMITYIITGVGDRKHFPTYHFILPACLTVTIHVIAFTVPFQQRWNAIYDNGVSLTSAIIDKYLMKQFNPMVVQSWYNVYQVFIMCPIILLLWYPKRKESTPFRWDWTIILISVFLSAADFAYFYALSYEDSMISIVSMVRRGSVVVSFLFGALFFREKNLKSKAVDLILVLIGMFFLYLGSK